MSWTNTHPNHKTQKRKLSLPIVHSLAKALGPHDWIYNLA